MHIAPAMRPTSSAILAKIAFANFRQLVALRPARGPQFGNRNVTSGTSANAPGKLRVFYVPVFVHVPIALTLVHVMYFRAFLHVWLGRECIQSLSSNENFRATFRLFSYICSLRKVALFSVKR